MPDPTKKKKASITANGKNGAFTVKSDKSGVVKKSAGTKMKALDSRGKVMAKGEKDGRMAARRQEALDNDVKKAGGYKKYLKNAASGQAKSVAASKKRMAEKKKKNAARTALAARQKAYEKKKNASSKGY